LRFSFTALNGQQRERLTGHYLPGKSRTADEKYFHGDDYVDYDAQSVEMCADVLRLVRQYAVQAPVLEVGCATGGLLAALDHVGLTAVGLDSSAWAIRQAAQRVGADRVWLCDVERDSFPAPVLRLRPFRTLVLWSVFEHFADPFAVLARLSSLCATGATLLLDTTNSQSLMRTLFTSQWEGYFDWTHQGIDYVSASSLREMLPQLGWRIENLVTRHIWDGNADPHHALWREWWVADARFRRFVVERDLGDFITCVAVKV
jgi:2-polyprenyl-3-methyl-5-hydroxy-6-metoxy-1,4-benzoquinol methylase